MSEPEDNSTDQGPLPFELWDPYVPYYYESETYVSANVAALIIVIVMLISNLDKFLKMPKRSIKIALWTFYGIDLVLNFLSAMVYNPRFYYNYVYRDVFDTKILYVFFAVQETLLSFMIYETISPWISMYYGRWSYVGYVVMAVELALGEATGAMLSADAWNINSEYDPSYWPLQLSWTAIHVAFEIAVFLYLAWQFFSMRQLLVDDGSQGRSLPAMILCSTGLRLLLCLGCEIVNIVYNVQVNDWTVRTPPALMVAANVTWSIRPMILLTDMARAKALASTAEKDNTLPGQGSQNKGSGSCQMCGNSLDVKVLASKPLNEHGSKDTA
ncbi:hypothetical protein SpCBS45565_g00816 [Spizellomyces sp. 'palustris']|nr:hypothetical protein SpCBS45565_g00816 [Spizellomyces sp. 'palustris']